MGKPPANLYDCTSDSKVTDALVDFLLDQRGPRKQGLAGVKRRRLKLEESRRERKEIFSFETLFHFFHTLRRFRDRI